MTNTLTRVYNSTLGIPQQALYRLWRALKDDDISPFSREGLLAPELLPILGIGASHETDVDVTELIGDQGFGGNLAADILLDPATYLTAGATGLAKAAKATRIASGAKKGGKEFLDFVGDLGQYDTAGNLATKVAEGIGEGVLTGKASTTALKNLEAVADSPLADVMKSGRQEEALFSLPGLSFLGAKWKAPELIQRQGSWWKAMNNLIYKEKLGLANPIDRTAATLATHTRNLGPTAAGLTDAVASLVGAPSALAKGLKTPIRAAYKTNLAEVTQESREAVTFLGDQADQIDLARRVDTESFQERYIAELSKEGADELSAATAALRSKDGGSLSTDNAYALMDNLLAPDTDLESLGSTLSKAIDDFKVKADGAEAARDSSKSIMEVDPESIPEEIRGKKLQEFVWAKGRWLREKWRKGFISDTPLEDGITVQAAKGHAQMAGMAAASARAAVPELADAKKRIVDSVRAPKEVVAKFQSEATTAFNLTHAQGKAITALSDEFGLLDNMKVGELKGLPALYQKAPSSSTPEWQEFVSKMSPEVLDTAGAPKTFYHFTPLRFPKYMTKYRDYAKDVVAKVDPLEAQLRDIGDVWRDTKYGTRDYDEWEALYRAADSEVEAAKDALAREHKLPMGGSKTSLPDARFQAERTVLGSEGFPRSYKEAAEMTDEQIAALVPDAFNTNFSGRTDSGWLGRGTYFTDKSERLGLETLGKERYAVHLQLKNPFVIGTTPFPGPKINPHHNPNEYRAALEAAGYDGVIARGEYSTMGDGTDEYLMFYPGQAKSTANAGPFGTRVPTEAEAAAHGLTQEAAIKLQARGDIRFQDDITGAPKGAMAIAASGEAIIAGFEKADASTAIHEVAHVLRTRLYDGSASKQLAKADRKVLDEWAGAADGVWSTSAEEKFARGFERYLHEGDAAGFSAPLVKVFNVLKAALKGVYQKVAGSAIDVNLTPEVKDVFDRLFKEPSKASDEAIGKALNSWQQSFPHPAELEVNLQAVMSDSISEAQAGMSQLRDYPNRLLSSAVAFQKFTGSKVMDPLIDVLGTEGRVMGANVDAWVLKSGDVARPDAVLDLLDKPIEAMTTAEIKRLRGAVDEPVLKSRLKNLEKRPLGTVKEQVARLEPPRRKGQRLEGLAATAGDYLLAVKDIERSLTRARKGEGLHISPKTIERIQRAEQEIQASLGKMLQEAYPKADPKDIARLTDLQDLAARQAGPFERGAPIAFMQRLSEPKYRGALNKLVGKAAKALPGNNEVQAMQARVVERSLTVEDMNLLNDALLEAKAPKLWEEIHALTGDIPKQRYSESWEADILTRISAQGERRAASNMINDVFSNPEAAAQDALMGGRITRVLDSPAKKVGLGVEKATFTGKKSANVNIKEIQADVTPRMLEIQQPDGKFRHIDLEELRANGVSVQVLGKQGDSLGDALVRHDGLHGSKQANETLEEGAWLMTGQDAVVQSMRQAVVPQKSDMAGILGAYDNVNFILKKFQTIFRASHHAGNLISNIAQTRAAGASLKNTTLAHVDMLKLISSHTDEGEKFYADLAARTGVEASSMRMLGKPAQLVESVEGMLAGKSLDELEEFMVLDTGLQQYGGLQIVERSLQRNLYGSSQAVEDIRLGGGVTGSEIAKSVAARSKTKGARRGYETLLSATRAPEFFARTTTVMALLREGHALDDAVDMAKLAHVDYSDLTKFERNVMKRAVPFYTFSRKYVPFALDKMARDPSMIGGWVKAIQQSDMMGIDENGKPILNYGKFEADLGRMNANVDALMAMAGVTESIVGGVSSEVQQVQGAGFATLSGGAVNVALSTFGAGSDQGLSLGDGVQELWDSVFVSRFVEAAQTAAQGGGFQPLADSSLSWLIPARFNAEPEKARKFQMNMARRALRRLEMQAQEATSDSQIASLQRQAAEIRQAIKTVQEDFGN